MLNGVSASPQPAPGEIPATDNNESSAAERGSAIRPALSPKLVDSERCTKPLTARKISDPESIRQEKIDQCAHDLRQAFSMPDEGSDSQIFCHFWYSNDLRTHGHPDFKKMHQAMEDKVALPSSTPRVAMLVGESYLLPILPELSKHCDVVLLTDHDFALLYTLLKRIELMMDCESHLDEEMFEKQIHDYIAHSYDEQRSSLRGMCSHIKNKFGHHWPFSSPERFNEVKTALSRVQFVPVNINLFCGESMEKLTSVLKKNEAGLHIINLSNIFDYLEEFRSNTSLKKTMGNPDSLKACHFFRQLPVHPEALVHTSRLIRSPLGSKVTKPAEHWDFLDQMLVRDICTTHRITGTLPDKVAGLIRQASKEGPFSFALEDLKILLANANAADMEDLMAHRAKLSETLEQSNLYKFRKLMFEDSMKNAVHHYQELQRSHKKSH